MSRSAFCSLNHARLVRDRLLDQAMLDGLTESEAEMLSQAGKGWKDRARGFQQFCLEHWDGYGIPDWSYVGELIEAIEYIANEEAKALRQAKAS